MRVRSAIHDTDEFFMVNSITLDLQDPGQSEYVIGEAPDNLTGQQSGFLRSLSSGINSSLDAVTSLDQTTKDQAIRIGKVEDVANDASDEVTQLKTDIPATYVTKTEVQQTTDSIKSSVSEVATTANSALSKATIVEQTANGLQTTISRFSRKVNSLLSTITQVQGDVANNIASLSTQVQALEARIKSLKTNQ